MLIQIRRSGWGFFFVPALHAMTISGHHGFEPGRTSGKRVGSVPKTPTGYGNFSSVAQARFHGHGAFAHPGSGIRRWIAVAMAIVVAALFGFIEAKTSFFQAYALSSAAKGMTFAVEPGANATIQFPAAGPYDERLGYAHLPSFISSLRQKQFVIEAQSRPSLALSVFTARHGYALYHQKISGGLTLRDRGGASLYTVSYPERTITDYRLVPPLVARTLSFIEDRELLETETSTRNPAIDWERFGVAALGYIAGTVDSRFRRGGGSTLATQIEKFQHSPRGLTRSVGDKLLQMSAASARVYLDGPDTKTARERILVTYLNTTPLGARAGFGEVIGIGDALWAWYGTDLEEANSILANPDALRTKRGARIYKQVLSLFLAQRRPALYLGANPEALTRLSDTYLRLLAKSRIIDDDLYRAALPVKLEFREDAKPVGSRSFVARKATTAIRSRLLRLTGATNLYQLDRLDLSVQSTLDTGAQRAVTDVLAKLATREGAASLGMNGENLIGGADPSRIIYSVVLYERGADRNVVRVHADSLNEPFDINSGAKLILGSTAKLRTLITYLNVIAEIHGRFANLSRKELHAEAASARDPLTHWGATYLAQNGDRAVQSMLDAAMQRRYSASPGEMFFTGGGRHVFHNFQRWENRMVPTVQQSFERSINLSFIRIMRDIARYYGSTAIGADDGEDVSSKDQRRMHYLKYFADQEGKVFLSRFYSRMHGRPAKDVLDNLARRTLGIPARLAVVFRTTRPRASVAQFQSFLRKYANSDAAGLDADAVKSLYVRYGQDKMSMADRAYVSKIHPLELWLAHYLYIHPAAPRDVMMKAAAAPRQESYDWLFKTRNERKQDTRIGILREQQAFKKIAAEWRKTGYPFDRLVASYATAIGSSGDRPGALAELVGIVLNGGVRLPTVDIERIHFAEGTPYETRMRAAPRKGERVMAPEVAETVRRAMLGVVRNGTAGRVDGAFTDSNGAPFEIGGKTGTGDNRLETYGAGGRVLTSQVVDRTATFAFFLGDRFYGTITAFVRGKDAAQYRFTSSLAVQLLKTLQPALQPLIRDPSGIKPTFVASIATQNSPVTYQP